MCTPESRSESFSNQVKIGNRFGRKPQLCSSQASATFGFQHDVRPIADLAHGHGALFYAGAIQAVGMIDIDVRAAGMDALCCGCHRSK